MIINHATMMFDSFYHSYVGFTLPYPFGDGFRVSWAKMNLGWDGFPHAKSGRMVWCGGNYWCFSCRGCKWG